MFRLRAGGKYRVLHSFADTDGAGPQAGLVRDAAGNLYGTTYLGGASGRSVVFKLDANGAVTVLHSFTGGADGSRPSARLVRDSFGHLYGTTQEGGAYGRGVVFKITPQ